MTRNRIIVALCIVGCLIAFLWQAAIATSSSGPEIAPPNKTKNNATPVSNPTTANVANPHAKAVTETTTHDFGVMDPYKRRRHQFVIRNEGNADLELQAGDTTCKCTISEVDGGAIPPGGEGKVELEWQTLGKHLFFTHSALVYTNDPQRSTIRFQVQGRVRMHAGADPPELALPSIAPGTSPTADTIVSSQVWDDFNLENITCSIEGVTWNIEPATEEALTRLGSKTGWQVTVTFPSDLPQGDFRGTLRFDVVPKDDPDKIKAYELPITGKVLRPLAVYGNAITSEGVIELGTLDSGEGTRKRLIVKLRDPQPELAVRQISVKPEFLNVTLTPYRPAGASGLYHLDIEVPKLAPSCGYVGSRLGELRMTTDHPRLKELALKIQLVIYPPRRSKLN